VPHRRAGSPYWYISYRDASGRYIKESSGTAVRAEAEELERRRKSEAWAQSRLGESPTYTVDQVLLEYLTYLGESPAGERARYACRHLYGNFSGQTDIEPEQIARYREQRQAAPGTIRKELGVLSAAYGYCRRTLGWDVRNPVEGRLGKKPEPRVRWISKDEGARLIEAARTVPKAPHLWPFIQLGLYTGMRRDEMLKLEWARVDLDQGLVYLRPQDQKGGRYDSVPLNHKAVEALEWLFDRKEGRWVFHKKGERIQRCHRSFATACRIAGIEDFRIHDMRHTFAAWLVQAGVSLREVSEVLRHTDVRVTMLYAHLRPDASKRAVAVLD